MNEPKSPQDWRDRMIFYPVAVVGALFCLTAFIGVASTADDPNRSLNLWLKANFTTLMLIETALLFVTAVGAMAIDRWRTLRRQSGSQSSGNEPSNTVEQDDIEPREAVPRVD